jgi:hypothetical protein
MSEWEPSKRVCLSSRIVAELTSKDVGQLSATTDSERMKKTLEGAGFMQKDMSGSDHEENFRYGAKKRISLSVREVINRAVETTYCPHSSKHFASHAIRGDGVRVQ